MLSGICNSFLLNALQHNPCSTVVGNVAFPPRAAHRILGQTDARCRSFGVFLARHK